MRPHERHLPYVGMTSRPAIGVGDQERGRTELPLPKARCAGECAEQT